MSNAVIHLTGRLASDPEILTGKNQRNFVTFRLAVNSQFGAQETPAAFYNCTGGEAMANRITKAGLSKGRLVNVVGSFNPRDYKTKDGATRTSLDVGLFDWSYVGSKPKEDDQGDDEKAFADAPKGTMHEESTINDGDDLPI